MMRHLYRTSSLGVILVAAIAAMPTFAQDPNAYPPDQQQQPPPQYPSQGQYPPAHDQYPTQQGQYPPPQGQYPPPSQGQYPAPSQGQYPAPSQGQYPPPQGQYPPPPVMTSMQLNQLVGPIALYPDGLLAQVLTASTYSYEINDAAAWAGQHQSLRGDEMAEAIRQDNLNFDPSVMALLPFPSVLNYMAQYVGWTQALGNAVLAQRDQVMDAVQQLRQQAYDYGYLRSNQNQRVVTDQGAIEIVPVTPNAYYVPYYNPVVVYTRPRAGFYVGSAIRFGPGITVGAAYAPWGWGSVGFGWTNHSILIDRRPWVRTWTNRGVYVHPYAYPYHPAPGYRSEHHEHEHHEHDRHEPSR